MLEVADGGSCGDLSLPHGILYNPIVMFNLICTAWRVDIAPSE